MDESLASASSEQPSSPRTLTGKRPTAASLQRQREYADWLQAQPHGEPDASQPDSSWAAFMAERRAEKERARLKQVSEKRRCERYQRRHGELPLSRAEQCQALEREFEDYQDARRKAVERRGRRYIVHEPSMRIFFEKERRKAKEKTRLRRITDERRAARHSAVAARREERAQQQREQAAAAAVIRQEARDAAEALRAERRATARSARPWSTEGQCEGKTRASGGLVRCRVHRSSPYAVAAPLRRGERFCGHHHPDKYTGVRCAGMRKGGKGQCRVWSGSCYSDAAPLRRGSPYCHHHRVRCAGVTRSGSRCTVTSSSEHDHAQPLREGAAYCVHHQPTQPAAPLAEPPQEAALLPATPAAATAPVSPISVAISSGFETPEGALPPSVFIATKSIVLEAYLDRMQARFPDLQYIDLMFGDVQKSVWVLPLSAQTTETGTLAAFMSGLGLSVEEVDLDVESDAESDVDSVRCDTEDDELPLGVYRDADGNVHDLDDGSYGTMVALGSRDSPPPSPHHVIYDSDY